MLVFRSSVWLLQPIDPLSHLGDYLPWWRSNVYVRICADICTFLCHRQFIHMMFVLSPRFDHRGDILRRDCAGGLFRVRQGVRRPLPSRCWERVDWFAAYPCTRRERKLWSCELIFRFTTFTLLLFHHSTRPLPASSTPTSILAWSVCRCLFECRLCFSYRTSLLCYGRYYRSAWECW